MLLAKARELTAPRNQHQVTDVGPPRVKGVLKVLAMLEHTPTMLKAKLIVERLENSRRKVGS
jgi:hypothetical protein